MKTYRTLCLLFGVALVQALPASESVKSTGELKEWANEKKLLSKLRNDSIDDIKQGNRTKKSIICVDVQAPEYDGCPPGCGDEGSPSVQEPPMFVPAISGGSGFARPPPASPSFSYQPTQQRPSIMPYAPRPQMVYQPLSQPDFEYGSESEESDMSPQGQVVYQPAPSAPVMRPQSPRPQMVYQPAPPAPVMRPQSPRPQMVYQPAPSAPVMRPQAPAPSQVMYHPAPSAPVMRPQPPPQMVYQPAPSAPVMAPQAPRPQMVYQPAPPAPVMRPQAPAPSQVMYHPAPSAPVMRPQPPPQMMYQPAPPAPVMRPQIPAPSQVMYHPAPSAPVMRPQPPPQMMYQPAPPAPVMRPQAPPQMVYQPAPSAPVMRPQPPPQMMYHPAPPAPVMRPQATQPQIVYPPSQSQVMYQPAPQAPIMMPQLPALLPPPPPPQIQLPVLRPPQLAGPIPQLPPCPPEEQYLIPGEDSHEVISYEMVPVSHHIPSSPSRVITTERPPYPCLPPGAPQPLPSQQSAASLTTVQQQSTVNQVQVLQANAYAAAPGNYGYPYPSGNIPQQQSSSPSNHHHYQQPFGGTQNSQPAGNVHMMQLPSVNPSHGQRYAPYQQQQNIGAISSGQNAGYQQAGYGQPMIVSGPTVDCVETHPVHNGAYGFQSSQSVAQSYAAAQSAAYSGYGLASFRSAEDADGASNSTIPQLYQTQNDPNYGSSVPSSRFSSYGRNYMHQKRDVTKKGTENKGEN